ncbi:ABC transporter ATP-binding protein [Oceanibacterium hippocampi]|uniref:Lipopolysaccharide export system ATP-binding protein LptB n=1 Tax=Oceanibacterium hippocampi TaxID=745714 RepID=A0A1Y5R6V5_9PROT|nr:ABC transporter ATP-binding protein [Oceanibacterium hippocampi]SLN10544.1 Lipopolysaccharide export system ATP-binding protein LptB [Oceanibacterium hippocampi]
MSARTLLEVAGVSRTFKGLRAVDAVSLSVTEGAIVALIGPNGAGKTTLFNLIAGHLVPDTGTIDFAGQRLNGLRPDRVCRAGIGRTFQIVRPFLKLSVLENVVVGALHRRRSVAEAETHAHRLLGLLDLDGIADRQASSLSLPERKRLEVARALATDPKLLLLDEVMAGMRPAETDQLVEVIRRLNRETGVTVLLTEHVMRAVMALAQEIYVLNSGRLIAHGAPEEVIRNEAVLECYLGAEAIE